MKKYLVIALCALLSGASAQAQQANDKASKTATTCVERQTVRANRMAARLQLDDKTQRWFVPLYVAYQDTLQGLRRNCPLRQQKPRQARLSDVEAQQLVETRLANDEKRVAIRRSYYKQFSKQLNPQQLLVLFGGNRQDQLGKYGKGGKCHAASCKQYCGKGNTCAPQRKHKRAKACQRNCNKQCPALQTAAK